MEQNAAAAVSPQPSPAGSSAAASAITSDLPYVLVPHRWTRAISEQDTVYYISPSGRVLLSTDDVSAYLGEEHSCRCHLDFRLRFDEVFSYDRSFASLMLPAGGNDLTTEENQCDSFWTHNLTAKSADEQIELLMSFTKVYLTSCQVMNNAKIEKDRSSVYSILVYLLRQLNKEDIKMDHLPDDSELLATFEWDDFLVTREGYIYPRFLTSNQLKHLSCELIIKMTNQFGFPEPFIVIISGIESNNNIQQIEHDRNIYSRGQKKKKQALSQDEIEERLTKKRAYQRDYYRKMREKETPEEKAKRNAYSREYAAKRKAEKQHSKAYQLTSKNQKVDPAVATTTAAPVNELKTALSMLTLEHQQLSCHKLPQTGLAFK